MKIYKRFLLILAFIFSLAMAGVAQTQIPLPPHASVWSGGYARGYWFVAPTDFTITGLKVAPEAGTGQQYIHLMQCFAQLPIPFGSPSTDFTTLAYISGEPNNTVATVNIPVQQGDTLVILGTVSGNQNSYTASAANHTSTIGTHSFTMGRAGAQLSIESGPSPNFWGYDHGTSYALGRVFIYYTLAGATDAGLETFVFPSDTLCEGPSDVMVRLKNHGPEPLIEVDIEWSVNQVLQPPYTWTGNLAVNDTDDVVIGTYNFLPNTTYDLKAYTHEPNFTVDTINNQNDTILGISPFIQPSPNITLGDTTLAICQGDTAWISGTLSGSPPWSFILKEGTTQHSFTNVTDPSVVIPMTPATSRNYTFELIEDATGCIREDGPLVAVAVQPAPPATITPMGPPAACMGDSVMLMGSVGLDFTYQWFVDGSPIPGADNYILGAKTGGDYTVQVTSPIGCANLSAPYTVYIHPLPQVSLGNDTALLPNHNVTLNAGAGFNSYLWSTGETSQTINVDSTGTGIGVKTVWVQVTDNSSCKGSDTILINFTPHPAVEGYITDASMQLFPNPTTGKVTLQLDRFPAGQVNITLYSVDGSRVYSRQHTVTATQEQITLDLQHLPEGVYLVRAEHTLIIVVNKVVVKRQ